MFWKSLQNASLEIFWFRKEKTHRHEQICPGLGGWPKFVYVSQTKIYPVQNWSVKKPIGAFLQTTAPVLDKIYGLMGG